MKYRKHTWVLFVLVLAGTVRTVASTVVPGTNVVVAPLTQAMWNQGRHYNRMCPVTDSTGCSDGRMWAGCTAVATAILMKHYEWPYQGETWYQDLNDEKSWANDNTSVSLRARFYRPYDWASMQDEYGHVTSGRASLAVGELMSDIGAVMHMNYGTSGSSTLRDNVVGVLEHNFRFDASELYQVDSFSPEVEKRIQAQLRDGHPIVSAGAAGQSGTGHTYVCDGYELVTNADGTTNTLYHFNFGWGGTSNGWYPLDAVFTAAKPGEAAVERPVENMFLGVYPQKAPLIHDSPVVTGPSVTLDWSVAACWTNRLTGFRVESHAASQVSVNEDLSDCWNVRTNGYGWEMANSRPYAEMSKPFYSWGNPGWPNQGVNANTTNAVAVSAQTSVTITYQVRKLKDNVKLLLIKSDVEGLDYDASNNYQDYPTLAELPGGSSESALETKSVTVSGSVLSDAFGNEPAYFGLKFTSGNGNASYGAGTELFRLVSFVVSGPGTAWSTVASQELDAGVRSCTFGNQDAGDHKFVVTACYSEREVSSAVEKKVRATKPAQPTVTLTSAAGQTLAFTVSNTSGFTYKFETQSNILRGTDAKEGNVVSYTFANPVADVGTHWIALTVTDTETGASARHVHITNPPEDHPLCPYAEPTIDAAVARGLREGKPVCVLVTGEVDNDKFRNLSGFLTTNEIVTAIRDGYVFTELCVLAPGKLALAESYWRSQPVALGYTRAAFSPATRAYAILIDPRTPDIPIPCTPNAYGTALNSQLDIVYPSVSILTVPNLIDFLGQNFGLNLQPVPDSVPTIDGGEMFGTVAVNAAGEYVVSPTEGTWSIAINDAGDHTMVVPPSVMAVSGVSAERLKVKSGAYDITGAFSVIGDAASGLYLSLSKDGSVTIGGETISVVPELSSTGSGELASVPFVVGADGVSVGVKTIPGLRYVLLRGEDIEGLKAAESDPSSEGVASEVADGARMNLKDADPPAAKAFYLIRVSVPGSF